MLFRPFVTEERRVKANTETRANSRRILYCHCAYDHVVPQAVKDEVLRRLQASGVPFDAVPDLCALAADQRDKLRQIAAERPLRIAACFPRAVRGLFAAAGAPLPEDGVEILNMRTLSADDVVAGLLPCACQRGATRAPASADAVADMRAAVQAGPDNGQKPWFPVIDDPRCINCQQCLSFCLFGVFGLSSEGQVEVRRPHNCKTDCPACARICPEAAIIFPKYGTAPINGAEVRPEDLSRESMQVDLSTRLGGNIHEMLRQRSARAKARFSPDQTEERALQERQCCLRKHRGTTGTPPEGSESPSGATPGSTPPTAD
jgi:NAD-dependent dihydropyrimidine dehydrogenase PreA subunit